MKTDAYDKRLNEFQKKIISNLCGNDFNVSFLDTELLSGIFTCILLSCDKGSFMPFHTYDINSQLKPVARDFEDILFELSKYISDIDS